MLRLLGTKLNLLPLRQYRALWPLVAFVAIALGSLGCGSRAHVVDTEPLESCEAYVDAHASCFARSMGASGRDIAEGEAMRMRVTYRALAADPEHRDETDRACRQSLSQINAICAAPSSLESAQSRVGK